MKRMEFSKETKRQALRRSDGLCEAVGKVYGLHTGERCNAPLSFGVEFDHYPVRAADGGSAELTNCVAVCLKCHKWKTRKFDVPMAAKGKRVSDKRRGISSHGGGFRTNRNGPFRRKMNGSIERR